MGKWDKDTAIYSRFEIMMQFMEAGIGCPDGNRWNNRFSTSES